MCPCRRVNISYSTLTWLAIFHIEFHPTTHWTPASVTLHYRVVIEMQKDSKQFVKCWAGKFCRVCKINLFYELSYMPYVGLIACSLPISFPMVVRIYVLNLIIIIKSEISIISLCLGKGHSVIHCMACYLLPHYICTTIGSHNWVIILQSSTKHILINTWNVWLYNNFGHDTPPLTKCRNLGSLTFSSTWLDNLNTHVRGLVIRPISRNAFELTFLNWEKFIRKQFQHYPHSQFPNLAQEFSLHAEYNSFIQWMWF